MRITVFGRPITQGSKTRTRWGMRDSNGDTLKPWRDNVRSAAIEALDTEIGYGPDPVTVMITFTFARPQNHYGTGKNAGKVRGSAPPFPSSHNAGDLDKCVRACFDSLTDAGVWRDDSQVVFLMARKVYAGTALALDRPGAVIDIIFADIHSAPQVSAVNQ
jgi:crossover junction endodeoxyribonuclease RusA